MNSKYVLSLPENPKFSSKTIIFLRNELFFCTFLRICKHVCDVNIIFGFDKLIACFISAENVISIIMR